MRKWLYFSLYNVSDHFVEEFMYSRVFGEKGRRRCRCDVNKNATGSVWSSLIQTQNLFWSENLSHLMCSFRIKSKSCENTVTWNVLLWFFSPWNHLLKNLDVVNRCKEIICVWSGAALESWWNSPVLFGCCLRFLFHTKTLFLSVSCSLACRASRCEPC